VGGRYRFLFFLVRTGLLDRRGFDRVVPREALDRILGSLPRVAVTERGELPPLLREFPELQSAGRDYEIAGDFDGILVLERTSGGGSR
jgi:hypothetical protein